MKITANQIADWAKKKKAQTSLPRLVRRLIHSSGIATNAAFPAGDSISLPGWDGELASEHGSPWVPKGKSYWELSCEAQVTNKANRDYLKRTKTSAKIRKRATLVIVTARKWSTKTRWLKTKRSAKKWGAIRAYDANDIEQWLEQSPAVALQFAEELGLKGQGVESLFKYWDDWSQQCEPLISAEALFIDREKTRERFITDILGRLKDGQSEPYSIKADDVEEAAAFVCASLRSQSDLSEVSLVVTDPGGWRFVEHNLTLKVAIAARPEIAEKPTRRKGLLVIIPYAAGDMEGHYRGTAGRDSNANLALARPDIYEFEKALSSIGLDEADAKRYAASTGRSWSVFRRRRAINPVIRKPGWLSVPQAGALSTLCLLGSWSAEKATDRAIVAQLSGRTYEEIERDLRYLARLGDAPVLEIGEVWKAKSPLELLDLFGDQITRDELDRYFEIARQILIAPDPELELPDEQRFAAQIYGKVRPQSGLLIRAICDTLIKLAVRGPQVPALSAANIEGRVSGFVHELFHDADGTRWLSLSSLLPALAEAAPDAFLKTVEQSLIKPGAPVTRLITETSGTGLTGRCWHSGLLWALEILAWAPERLTRVALVLARLAHIKIKGNWGNSPKASLLGILRSWYPQTAANLDQRIAVLDNLLSKEPDIAFDLLDGLVHSGQDFAHHTARPIWRGDDAGVGRGVKGNENQGMIVAAADRLIVASEGQPERIARLIKKIRIFDPPRVQAILALADQFTRDSADDENREVIRTALRSKIHWHRNYDKVSEKELDDKLKPIEDLYERLSPQELIARHRWLFADAWPQLPARVRDDKSDMRSQLLEKMRIVAIREIYAERGMTGMEQLAAVCTKQPYIGVTMAKLGLETTPLSEWIFEEGGDFTPREALTTTISGLLRALESPHSTELVISVLERGRQAAWRDEKAARFLMLAREERVTWDLVTSCGPEVGKAYWSMTIPGFWLRGDSPDLEYVLHHLLEAGRPRTALQVSHLEMEKVDVNLLTEMLERMLQGQEPNGELLDSWDVGKAIEQIEASGAIERGRLIRLEFGLIPALGFEGEQRAALLYEAIMADPKLFTELLCLIYKPEKGDTEEPLSEAMQRVAQNALHILDHCHRLPGTQPDGTIDKKMFIKFIDEARDLCRAADRLAPCDIKLGHILAYAPADSHGVWPPEPVREVLDRYELEDMRRGFQNGVWNKRGVTTKSPGEGGGQERELATTYRKYARAVQNSHVNVAAMFEEIARSYENDGVREDTSAQLRRESY